MHKSWFRVQISFCLIALLLGFGFTAAGEMFFPAAAVCQSTHVHTDFDSTYCDYQVQVPAYQCIHSTTTLDLAEVSPPAKHSEEKGTLNLRFRSAIVVSSDDYYYLRAPPSIHQ